MLQRQALTGAIFLASCVLPPYPPIELHEISSLSDIPLRHVSGAHWTPEIGFVIWSRSERAVFVAPATGAAWVIEGVDPVGVHVESPGPIVEVLDAAQERIYRYHPDGRTDTAAFTGMRIVPYSAIKIGHEWIVSGLAPLGTVKLMHVANHRAVDYDLRCLTHLAGGPSALAPIGIGFSLSMHQYPHDGLLIDVPARKCKTLPRSALPGSPSHLAMPLLDVGMAFIRVIADPASDMRTIDVYDQVGRFRRRTRVDLPVGLTSSLANHGLVVGMTNIGSPRAAVYRVHVPH
jgi:hypothetical protein